MTPEEIEKYVDAASIALRLPIAPAHRAGVLHNFAVLAQVAQAVDGFPLTPEDEPAPLWRPGA